MREILFRGKRIDDYVNDKSIDYAEKGAREWAYGDIIHRRYYKNKDVVVIRTEDSGFDNYSDYEVDPSTIGQYTGLTANGKKIFEGDIVKVTGLYPDRDGEKRIWRRFRVGEVFYYHGAFYFDKWLLCKTSEKCLEIIGNIHDNPELLEDKP
ncbi:YopX family protein [Ruminococcus difficilis]|uniref:YopX protein domain-containing protein n=1 Tax=Ruminococcus difficilis TaxID=2763069 RepID=A0A935C3A9_9FIRM|nr:YopX family protein [Ruminococcus difficilis]MBK6089655.1 hypothetical protein [Ruminococcus difficilis]